MQLSYRSFVDKVITFLLRIRDLISDINNTLKTSPQGRDIGYPELKASPITEHIGELYEQSFNAAKDKTKIEASGKVRDHLVNYFDLVDKSKSEINRSADELLEYCFTQIDKPSVALRDFHVDSDCTKILVYIATRTTTGEATIEKLESVFPEYRGQIEDMINRISGLWQDTITFDTETKIITLLPNDYKDIRTVMECRHISTENKIAKTKDESNLRWGKFLHMARRMNPDIFNSEFITEWNKYLDRDLQDFETLFSERNIAELNNIEISKGIQFLQTDYSTLKIKTNMTKYEIIECKLGVASRINYDPSDFELETIPPSLATKSRTTVLSHAIKHLKSFFEKDRVTYSDILTYHNEDTKDRSIILTTDQTTYRRICYKIIAFVNYFSNKCIKNDPFIFKPKPKNWSYSKYLTDAENENLNLSPVASDNIDDDVNTTTNETTTQHKNNSEKTLSEESIEKLDDISNIPETSD